MVFDANTQALEEPCTDEREHAMGFLTCTTCGPSDIVTTSSHFGTNQHTRCDIIAYKLGSNPWEDKDPRYY